jgi:uncharacterized protein (TIGR02217 family)
MPRINMRLPPRIAAGFKIGPDFNTTVAAYENGFEDRQRNWLYGRWRGSASYAAMTPIDQDQIDSIFQVTAGMWMAFRVRDASHPRRYKVTDQLLAPVIGTDTPLQVMRTYDWGAFSTPRMIQAVDAASFVLKLNGAPITTYTLDDELGLVTPGDDWAAGTYTWSGKHDLWMRFNSDWGASTAVSQNITTADIELVEDRQR